MRRLQELENERLRKEEMDREQERLRKEMIEKRLVRLKVNVSPCHVCFNIFVGYQ